jgi:hypothetical protein
MILAAHACLPRQTTIFTYPEGYSGLPIEMQTDYR